MKIPPSKVRWFVWCTLLSALVWWTNTSQFLESDGKPFFIAHRGVAPVMNPEHEDVKRCLSRIYPAEHTYIENTIPSIGAAFNHGAAIVEVDARMTADGDFAVFHDDQLDCKTEAEGAVADYRMAELKALDVGYGYVTEARDYPLRGKGIGLMPSLNDVLDRFPQGYFLIDLKNDSAREAKRLGQILLSRHDKNPRRFTIFAGPRSAEELGKLSPRLRVFSRETASRCVRDYMLIGWSGYVPGACRNTVVGMYADWAWVLWGWPHKFVERMDDAATLVILTHPRQTESVHALPETEAYARMIPKGYRGAVNTHRIDRIHEWLHRAKDE